MDVRRERVVVETDRYRVEGMLTLPSEGYRSRVSDHVNRRDHEFFTILDAQLVAGGDLVAQAVHELGGRGVLRRARGDDGEERGIPGAVQPRLGDEDDAVGATGDRVGHLAASEDVRPHRSDDVLECEQRVGAVTAGEARGQVWSSCRRTTSTAGSDYL